MLLRSVAVGYEARTECLLALVVRVGELEVGEEEMLGRGAFGACAVVFVFPLDLGTWHSGQRHRGLRHGLRHMQARATDGLDG